ncbi:MULTISPECIES: RHS repeat-associated core domain-containing protein [Cellulophaga]|uniref:RHS repeat-associated core domain-containing protein n=2 Tax=Flavobacteriaceae TaxID=49546 RepID=UPI0005A208B8|nr:MULTISPECIES: RHS repeat-associated core domain-containing protein [Cellulophaga]
MYYNRFRYYSPDTGTYLSKDPIGLNSREYNLYAYVSDTNSIIDPFGLDWNYVLSNNGTPYYHGRASDNASMQDVANRHSKTTGTDGARFGEGDTMQRKTGVGTDPNAVRGIEQRGIAENDLLGRGSDKARGNKINGISEAKQGKAKGQLRLNSADDILNGKKVSELPTLDELKFKGGCKG